MINTKSLIILFIFLTQRIIAQDTLNNNKLTELYEFQMHSDSLLNELASKVKNRLMAWQLNTTIERNSLVIEIPDNIMFKNNNHISDNGKEIIFLLLKSLDLEADRYSFQISTHHSNSQKGFSKNYEQSISKGVVIAQEFLSNNSINVNDVSLAAEIDDLSFTEIKISFNLNVNFSLIDSYVYVDNVKIFTQPEVADKYLIKIDFWNTYLSNKSDEELIKYLSEHSEYWVGNSNSPFRAIARKYYAIIVSGDKVYKMQFAILPNRVNEISIGL